MAKNNKIYLAAGFFDKEQNDVLSRIENICIHKKLDFFSPRLECFCQSDGTPEQRKETFKMNKINIVNCSFVLARIDDFDVGTVWEIGYAYAAGKDIYVYSVVEGRGLNLMLVESCEGFLSGWNEIESFLHNKASFENFKKWKGEII